MSSAPTRQTRIPSSPDGNRQHIPATPFVTKKMPQSERPADVQDRTAQKLDDVIFLRLPEVKALTGLSKTTLYELIHEKSFPAPVRLGPRAVAWVKSEIRQWAIERVQAPRSVA
jgi:predicted DNA-binding transcriptional regulator AlpA